MSHIAVAIDKLIRESKPQITGADLARAAGMQMAQMSRIRNGIQIWVNPKDLHNIALALCKDVKSKRFAMVHARLLHARLLDECAGPGAKLISISLNLENPSPALEKQSYPLPPSMQADLEIIAKNIETDRNVRDLVRTVANLCANKPVSQPASK